MPPAISDDERSDPLSGDDEILPPKKPAPKKAAAAKSKTKSAKEEEVDQEMPDIKNGDVEADDDEDDDEDNADEYVVEKIMKHAFDNGKDCLYEVKWLGYEKPEDRTWEPEENLSGAMDVLRAYWDSVGGKPQAKPKTPAKKGTKRKSTQDTPEVAAISTTTKKRGRKSIKTADEPEDDKMSSLPEGSWEDHVQLIDAVERPDEGENKGVLMIYLLWENGNRTQHTAQQCRQKCPQKLLDYYESKLVFKTNSDE